MSPWEVGDSRRAHILFRFYDYVNPPHLACDSPDQLS